jgi:hypothetical protein
MPFTIVDDPDYARQAEQIADIQRLDDALNGLMWAIANNPEVYDVIIDTEPPIHIAKSNRIMTLDGDISTLRIWFSVDYENEIVTLLKIRRESEEESG